MHTGRILKFSLIKIWSRNDSQIRQKFSRITRNSFRESPGTYDSYIDDAERMFEQNASMRQKSLEGVAKERWSVDEAERGECREEHATAEEITDSAGIAGVASFRGVSCCGRVLG